MILLLDVLGKYERAEQKAKAWPPIYQNVSHCLRMSKASVCEETQSSRCWGVRGRTKVQQRRKIYLMANGASSLLLLRLEFPFYTILCQALVIIVCNRMSNLPLAACRECLSGSSAVRRTHMTHFHSLRSLRGLSAHLGVAA